MQENEEACSLGLTNNLTVVSVLRLSLTVPTQAPVFIALTKHLNALRRFRSSFSRSQRDSSCDEDDQERKYQNDNGTLPHGAYCWLPHNLINIKERSTCPENLFRPDGTWMEDDLVPSNELLG